MERLSGRVLRKYQSGERFLVRTLVKLVDTLWEARKQVNYKEAMQNYATEDPATLR